MVIELVEFVVEAEVRPAELVIPRRAVFIGDPSSPGIDTSPMLLRVLLPQNT